MSTPGRRRAERRGDPVLPDPPEKTRMLRAAGTVGASTLLSRALGYARDMLVAWYFGAGLSTDAFIAAFRIPNLVRRLLGEGALSAAFVPVFSGILLRQGRREAFAMARSALRLWAAALLAAVSTPRRSQSPGPASAAWHLRSHARRDG